MILDFFQAHSVEISAFFTLIIQAVIAAAVPVIVSLVVKWVAAKAAWAASQLKADQLSLLRIAVVTAIKAAEQSGLAGVIAEDGKAKKAAAIQWIQAYLNQLGLKIPVAVIEAELEAAILEGLQMAEAPEERAPAVGFYAPVADDDQ